MSENSAPPFVTVVIAARPGDSIVASVAASRKLDYPRDKLEIIVARGKQPAVQRNTAVRAARGELVYFLDDDSLPPPQNLRIGVPHFADPKVQMAGGPNLCPPESPPLEQAFATVMGTWLAFGPSRARYTPVGSVRETSEKEIILCNQLARRSSFLEAGGFDESLYPNEENALMDELQRRGGKLIYDPGFRVYRRPRPNLKAFLKMLGSYGRGRAEQLRLHPSPGSALNFIPPLFCVYLLAAPFLPPWCMWPLVFYIIAVLTQTIYLDDVPSGLRMRVLPLISCSHIFYGLGFWRGLFTKLKPSGQPSNVEVKLEIIPPE